MVPPPTQWLTHFRGWTLDGTVHTFVFLQLCCCRNLSSPPSVLYTCHPGHRSWRTVTPDIFRKFVPLHKSKIALSVPSRRRTFYRSTLSSGLASLDDSFEVSGRHPSSTPCIGLLPLHHFSCLNVTTLSFWTRKRKLTTNCLNDKWLYPLYSSRLPYPSRCSSPTGNTWNLRAPYGSEIFDPVVDPIPKISNLKKIHCWY